MRRPLLIVLCAAVLTAGVRDAAAQTPRPSRPYRGLFAGGVDNPATLLTLQTSAGVGYDTNVLFQNTALGGGTADPRAGVGSTFSNLTASMTFLQNGTRFSMAAAASTDLRHYADLVNDFVPAHSGSVGASFSFSERSRITATQGVSYQQFLSLLTLPQLYDPGLGLQPPPDADLGSGRRESVGYNSNVEWSQTLSRRATLSFVYWRQFTDFNDDATIGDFTSSTASGRFLYSLGRGLAARIGYGYQGAKYPSVEDGDYSGSIIDAGIDFSRALSFSRRTTLTFATGTSANRYQDNTYYRLLGNAQLTREFGRTWNATLVYDRTVDLQPAYPQPVLGDAATFSVSGFINRRLQFNSSASAVFGNVGFSGTNNAFDTYTGSAGITLGLTRNLGVNAGYTFYSYDFEEGAVPPWFVGLPQQTNRHSVQANLVVWAPLFYRARKPDVTR